jgi:hypothetical protein
MTDRMAKPMPNSFLGSGLLGVDIPGKGGRAVVATRPLRRGALLIVFGGDVLSRSQVEALPADHRRLVLQVDEDCYLFSSEEGPADWINHSCEPNAGLRGQISLVALREIAAGEEITFDYAMSDGSDYDEFDCECGAPSCRGRVTGNDWMQLDLVERYRGLRSPYLDLRLRRSRLRSRSRRAREAS